jgi:ABC-type nitrate/sulfonate/bicarbonate transport system permease component
MSETQLALPAIETSRPLARFVATGAGRFVARLAELIASNQGIGYMIEYYSGIFDSTGTYAAILVLVILSVGLTEVLSRIEQAMSRGRAAAP